MKMQVIREVVGIRIELSLQEALQIAQLKRAQDKVIKEVRTALTGSGVDPDTGE